MRPLRKCQMNNLKELYLCIWKIYEDKNRIIDFTPLKELHAPLLNHVWTTPQTSFDWYFRDTFDCQQSCSWILLLQSNNLSKVCKTFKYWRHQAQQRTAIWFWGGLNNDKKQASEFGVQLPNERWHQHSFGVRMICTLYIKSLLYSNKSLTTDESDQKYKECYIPLKQSYRTSSFRQANSLSW